MHQLADRLLRDRAANRAAPARLAAALTILLSLAALIGWARGIPTLASVLPGSVEMKANTACGLILSAIALLILSKRPSAGRRALAWILCCPVFLMGMATAAEYVGGRTFGIDELLFVDKGGAYDVFRGRMSPFTAAAFIGIATALIALPYPRFRILAKMGAASAILLGATVLLCYLWNAGELITDRWLPPVALNTAAGFALLGWGILLAPNEQGNGLNQQISELAGMEVRILAAFSIALGLLMIGGTYTYRTTVQFADSVEWVAHSQEVRAAVASLYGSLAGSEVALRDYLLTKDDNNLTEHQRLCGDVLRHLADVQRLTADNATQQRNVAALRPIVMGRLEAMASALTAFADFGLPAARAVIAVTRRTNATQSVRAQTDILDAEEVRLLGLRQKASADVRSSTLLSLLATLALASALFIALFRGVHREVRARREAEDAVRASDRYSRSVLDSSPDCLCVLTLEGRISQMTARGRRLMDIDESVIIDDREWLDAWTGDDRIAAETALADARAGKPARFHGFCPTVKGTPKWWDVIVMPILGEDDRPERLLTVSRDISEVKRTESDLRETNRFLDSLIDNLPVMVAIKDAGDLRIVRHNDAFAQLLGFTPDALHGKSADELFTADEARLVNAKDREALEAGGLVEVPELSLHTAHLGLRTFHSMTVPINDRTGRPRYLMAISVDVTARKLAEQAIQELNTALEAKARQLESSVQELESFSYSVSHDLRAPLRAIDGFALMIEEDCSDKLDAEGRRYLAVIRGNSRRMGALIDDLLSFSRLGRLPVAAHEVNVESLVREVVDEIVNGRSIPHDLNMQNPPQIEIEALPPARGDRELLRQVWLNLIANAVKYSSKAAAPRITVSGRQNGIENLYSVRDNGVGFDMNYAEKLFGVFQRLHRSEEFSGTGVGLAIVHRVISRHGGRVWAEGRINDGATFSFALPKGGS
jgi:PAS domain S-box-containing protein